MTFSTLQNTNWARWSLLVLVAIVSTQTELAAQPPLIGPAFLTATPVIEEPSASPATESNRTDDRIAQLEEIWNFPEILIGEPVEARTLTLDQSRSLIMNNSRILRLAALAVQEKQFARSASKKDFLPKVLGSSWYYHFDSDLGSVVTTPGIFTAATAKSLPLVNQDSSGGLLSVVQPITPLLKVKQVVNLASADVRIAKTNVIKARRELLKGVEQLFFGLYIAQQGRGLAQAVLSGAEQMAKQTPSPLANLAQVQAEQGLHTVEGQISELTTQMNHLLEFPLNTELILEAPSPIESSIGSEEDAIDLALGSSPQIGEAKANVAKAAAALKLAKSDFVPTVAVLGLYVTQDTTDVIQDGFSGVGVTASHTLFEWGKKKQVLCQRRTTVALAQQNLRNTAETVRLNAMTAYRNFTHTEQAAKDTESILKMYDAVPLPKDPRHLIEEIQDRAAAQTAAGLAQIAHRSAYAELMALTGQIDQYYGY